MSHWNKYGQLTGSAPTAKNTPKAGGYKACYHSHPALPLKNGLVIYGGSCLRPAVSDADVYIGFDSGMKASDKKYPWVAGESFLLPIPDRNAPSDVTQFKKMITWTIQQLEQGKKVHAGCIGGHGRTGLFFAALVAVYLGRKDAIKYVRENYCKKAVESVVQTEWLVEHFGVDYALPRDEADKQMHSSAKNNKKYNTYNVIGKKKVSKAIVIKPVRSPSCVFGEWVTNN